MLNVNNYVAQKRQHDVYLKKRVFKVDDPVLVKNFGSGPTWLSGIVKEVRGPLSYMVTLSDSREVHKNVDKIRIRTVASTNLESDNETSDDFLPVPMTESTPSPVSSTSGSCSTPTMFFKD